MRPPEFTGGNSGAVETIVAFQLAAVTALQ